MRLRTEDLTWRKIENDVILLDLRSSKYLRLNPTGALLWDRLVEGADEDGLAKALVDDCGAAPERAARDVETFLDQLRASELIS